MEFFDGPGPLRNLFLDERNQLRTHTDIEKKLRQVIDQLPEEDNCHDEREAFQLGAGFAYLEYRMPAELRARPPAYDPGVVRHAFNAYQSTLPRGLHRDLEGLYKAVERRLEQHIDRPIPPHIDEYAVDSAIAFLSGYELTTDLLAEE